MSVFWLIAGVLIVLLVACRAMPAQVAVGPASSTGQPTTAPLASPSQTPIVIVATPTALPPEVLASLDVEEQLVTHVYDRVGPSVVNITSQTITYDFFFNPIPQEGTGSGFVWDKMGHIITNDHVIKGADEVHVTLADGTTAQATVVGADPLNDLAVLSIDVDPRQLNPVELGNSDHLRVGQRVIAIGNPFGLERTLTTGVVSAVGRIIETGDFLGEVIQTDAAINPGNSGGPLLNSRGQLIAVNTAIFSPSGASAGIGFAIPVSTVKRVVPVLIEQGRYPHPWLGIRGFDITPELASRFRRGGLAWPADQGVLVVGVYRRGPAHEAGIQGGTQRVRIGNLILPIGGDIIVAVNGIPIKDQRDLSLYLESQTRVGETVELRILRDSRKLTVPVKLTERPTLR